MDDSCYPLVRYEPAGDAPLVVLPQGPLEVLQEDDLHARCRAVVGKILWLLLLACCLIRWLRVQGIQLRQQAHYWRAAHRHARQRQDELQRQVQLLQAQIRDLEKRLYGRKTETTANRRDQATNTNTTDTKTKKKRGQQPNKKGPKRRNYEHLPISEETILTLPDDERDCGICGKPREEIPGTDDGVILEIEVKAHRRVYRRKRYRCTCGCAGQPALVTPPPPPKLIPKSSIGISLWIFILLHKFQFHQPLHRVLAELRGLQLDLAPGTITGGLQKIVPLIEPLYQGIVEHNRAADHWHADETRWLVFVPRDDKAGFAWTLWVFAAAESVVFVLDPTRAHAVPEGHFEGCSGVANVDRYSSYKAMKQVKNGDIILAFCWAHVRRDFLAILTGWPELKDWAWSWVEAIGLLYHTNHQRLAAREDPAAFAVVDQSLRQQLDQLVQRRDQELAQPELRQPQRKALTSLRNHWSGLTVFVDRPDVPMDNNEAERCARGPVVGRKNYYGSGALWSGRLAAMLFSLIQTLGRWQLDVRAWLTWYLTACAEAGGKAPADAENFLPWNLSAEQRKQMPAKPPPPSTATPPTPPLSP